MEFTQTLYAVADDVYMNVSFNPDYVKEYRLIGFDNRVGALKDSLSIIEGGEIGSGHSMMAVFEVVPTDQNKDALKYNLAGENFADVRVQYRRPQDTVSKTALHSTRFELVPFDKLNSCYRFSTAVIMFGSLLKDSPYTRDINWNDIVDIAEKSSIEGDLLQKCFLATLYARRIPDSPGVDPPGVSSSMAFKIFSFSPPLVVFSMMPVSPP